MSLLHLLLFLVNYLLKQYIIVSIFISVNCFSKIFSKYFVVRTCFLLIFIVIYKMDYKIKDLRKQKNKTQQQMADILQITQKTYYNYESGTTEAPHEILQKIADYFDVSVDYLLGREIAPNTFDTACVYSVSFRDTIKILRNKKNLTHKGLADLVKVDVANVIEWEETGRLPNRDTRLKLCEVFNIKQGELLIPELALGRTPKPLTFDNARPYSPPRNIATINVYGKIPAGIPFALCEDITDTEEIPADWMTGGREYFGLVDDGDSMLPKFEKGDTLIFQAQNYCESGRYCAVIVNGDDATFKKVILHSNGITLQPLNADYSPTFYSTEQIKSLPVRILGVLREVRRHYR
jgi:repressor LexA